jgi:hypothetical protein
MAKFGRGRRNPGRCIARGCKGGLAGEMRPRDKGVFEFYGDEKREQMGRERDPLGR